MPLPVEDWVLDANDQVWTTLLVIRSSDPLEFGMPMNGAALDPRLEGENSAPYGFVPAQLSTSPSVVAATSRRRSSAWTLRG